MSGDARISGRIAIDPPVTWAELWDQQWAIGQATDHYPDAYVKLATTEENTADGVVMRYSGIAIVATDGETNGYTLEEDVDRIAQHVATAPDGTPRTFTGWLHLNWGHGEYQCRVIVRNGRAVKVEPQVVWPEGARDEDAAAGNG